MSSPTIATAPCGGAGDWTRATINSPSTLLKRAPTSSTIVRIDEGINAHDESPVRSSHPPTCRERFHGLSPSKAMVAQLAAATRNPFPGSSQIGSPHRNQYPTLAMRSSKAMQALPEQVVASRPRYRSGPGGRWCLLQMKPAHRDRLSSFPARERSSSANRLNRAPPSAERYSASSPPAVSGVSDVPHGTTHSAIINRQRGRAHG